MNSSHGLLWYGRMFRWSRSLGLYYEKWQGYYTTLRPIFLYMLFHFPHTCFMSMFLILLSDRHKKQYARQVSGHMPSHRSHENKLYQELLLIWDSNLGYQLSEFVAICPLCLSRIWDFCRGQTLTPSVGSKSQNWLWAGNCRRNGDFLGLTAFSLLHIIHLNFFCW